MAKTPAWQRAAGKNPEGGLNEKGRASLRAAGHDIKRPQPEGGPRKRSFCARMEGMKRKNTSAETANDPDSRINKSLRKWKCADGGSVDPYDSVQQAAKGDWAREEAAKPSPLKGLMDIGTVGATYGLEKARERMESPLEPASQLVQQSVVEPAKSAYHIAAQSTGEEPYDPYTAVQHASNVAGAMTLGAGAFGSPVGSIRSGVTNPLYHGSPIKGLTELRASDRGPLGPGIYTSEAPQVAEHYTHGEGQVYQVPHEKLDIYRGHGHRSDEEWFGYQDDRRRLIDAVPEEHKSKIIPIIEKMWSGDGYPLYQRIRGVLGSDEAAQNLFKKAGFHGISGLIDGPETLIFSKKHSISRAKGGPIWDKPRPKKLGKPEPLSSKEKASAKASAKAAGRPYPNLVDNMRAARADGGPADDRAHEFIQEQLQSGEPQVPQYVAENDFPARAARGVEAVDTAASRVNNLLANVAGQPAMRSPEGRTASEVVQSAMPVDPYQAVQQAAMQWREGDKLGAAETMAAGMPMLGIVPVDVAKSIGKPSLPKSEIFERAITSHPGARIEEGSLVLPLIRGQKPEQHLMPSVRDGVFYLPQGDKNFRYYNSTWDYGGPERLSGETAYNNPLFVKGGTGGKAPEAAYASLLGKDAMKKLESDVGSVAREQWWMEKQDKDLYRERVANFLEEHGIDPAKADYIINNSRLGNQLRYALQENIIGNEARKAGYDSIIGYGLRRDPQKTPFMTEIFDLRESNYPGKSGEYKLHEQFRANGGEVEGDVQFAPDDPYAKVQEAANLPMMARNDFAMRMPEPEVRYDTGPQPGEAELKAYDPTIKERIYQGIAGTEERPSPERAQFARGVSQMAEFAPVLGNVMAGQEAQRRGDTKGMLMAALPVPGMATEARMAEAAISPAQEAAKEAYQRVLNAQGLYSHAAEAAANLPQAKGSYEQMMAMLQKAGVKPEEMRWSGVEQFAGQPVTREQLVSHFEQNAPKIEETVLGSYQNPYSHRTADEWQAAINRAERSGNFDEAERLTNAWEHFEGYGAAGASGSAKFQQYTIPGGENYREVLLGLPETKGESRYRVHFPNGRSVTLDREQQANALAEMYPGSRVEERPQASEANYRSQHWDQPNVLGHLRMSDRTGPEGEKILHLEELQSDWGQQGRKKGFGKYTELPSDRKVIESKNARGEPVFHVEGPEGKTETAREYSMQNAINSWINNHQGVPSAPYVESTKNWVDLGLKRALKEAAEGGYGKMVWTPGEQQAARYDLSKQIDRLVYNPNLEILMAYKNGKQIINRSAAKSDLEGIVGKDVAKNLLASEGQTLPGAGSTKYHILEGQDLNVGGEGMKSFYDKMVPTRLKELLKKIDPQAKMSMTEINGEEGPIKVPTVEITSKIREAVKKGLPLYAKGGEVVNNADPYDNIQLAAKISPRARRASK